MLTREPLLIVDDDPVQQALLERILTGLPYALTISGSAGEALDAFDKLNHKVVICDIHLPGDISGTEILKRLMEKEKPPVVIMLTSETGIRQIIDTLRLGAYDYVLKPADPKEFQQIVTKAFDHAHTSELLRNTEKERVQRMESQLATKRVAEGLMRRQNDKFAKALFGNIHTSFTQGKGVGAMTTLVSMLAGATKTADGKNYLVATDVLDMILDNQTAVSDMIGMFGELQLLVSQDFVLFDVSLGEFHAIIRDTIYGLKPMAEQRGHRIVLSELNPRFSGGRLKLNWELMRKGLKELILNAMKFSPPETTVIILVEYLYTRVQVTILNTPLLATADEPAGVPEESRKAIFEPFFRLSRVVHEQYGTLEYGLGLTFVEKIVQMHKGEIRCTTIRDFENEDRAAGDLIAFEIELPS
jgi:DNA-binding response OmpR family regulator